MSESLYVRGKEYMVFGGESDSGLYKIGEGKRYFGFTVSSVGDNYVWLDFGDGKPVPIEKGRWLHFENIKTVTEVMYGDEFESTVGRVVDVARGVFSTPVLFDKTELGGINPDRSILAAVADDEGNPSSRIAVILFGENDNPRYDRVIKRTKQAFLNEYRLWNAKDGNALSFLEEHELRCEGYEADDFGASYVLKRMFDHCLVSSVADIFSELYDEGLADELVEEKVYEFFDSFTSVVSYYGGPYYQLDAHKEGFGSGQVYHFTDERVTVAEGESECVEIGLYNTDIDRAGKYNMVLATLADLDDEQLLLIRKNIIERIMRGESCADYLDTLGFPILVQYNSKHYRRLAPTVARDTGRLAQIKLEYVETGHNQKGKKVDFHFSTTPFTMRAGYLCLYDSLYDKYGNSYPRSTDYIKIEEIGEDYIDVRLPPFFDGYKRSAKSDEDGEPHRIKMGETLTVVEDRTVTCHKYSWHTELRIKFIRS